MKELDRWHDMAALQRDHDTALRELEKQGLIRCQDPHLGTETKRIFTGIILALQRVIMKSSLSLVYCYDQRQQPPNLAGFDGYSSVHIHEPDGRRVSSIGVSVQALQRGDEYAAFVLLHELAHITGRSEPEHGKLFHIWLDMLIASYNEATSAKIINDYYGLESRRAAQDNV
ncbi:MAG: hypothetical protein K2O11_10490 [Oscillospiraceae bacterium]|nr:hypothetical protein [Oscillospiraceae bacterium]